MKKILTACTLIICSLHIYSDWDVCNDSLVQQHVNIYCDDFNFARVVEELIDLKPLSDGASRKEEREFRAKYYTLRGETGLRVFLGSLCQSFERGDSECYMRNEKFTYDQAVAELNILLLLNDYLKKYGADTFVGLAKHAGYLDGRNYEGTSTELGSSLCLLTDCVFSWDYRLWNLANFAVYLEKSESIDIGFKGPVELFSKEYYERIKRRIENIDIYSGGILSILREGELFKKYSEMALKHEWNYAYFQKNYISICEDIFDENQTTYKNKIKANYLKEIDFCDKKDRDDFITGIYSVDPETLKHYSPDIYMNAFYIKFFPTFNDDIFEYGDYNVPEFFLKIGPEILFNARYGVSSGFDIVKELINYKESIQNAFYENITSLDDLKNRTLDGFTSLPNSITFKKLIYPPRNDKEERIYKAFEDYIDTPEFKQDFTDLVGEKELREIIKDPVAKELVELKAAMEIVTKCYESRKGYAAIYINLAEYKTLKSEFEKDFKNISSALSAEINEKLEFYGFDTFINWGVETHLKYSGIEYLSYDWNEGNAELCTINRLRLQGISF